MNCLLKATVVALALTLSATAFAMSPDEARTAIRHDAVAKRMAAKDVSQAIDALERLMNGGAPVDHAYAVVKAAIDDGVHGTELAAIARTAPPQAQREMQDDIVSPTRGEFGRGSGAAGAAGRGLGTSMGGVMAGRRP